MRYVVDDQATRFPETPWRVMDSKEKPGRRLVALFKTKKEAENFAQKLNQEEERQLE